MVTMIPLQYDGARGEVDVGGDSCILNPTTVALHVLKLEVHLRVKLE